MQNEKLKLLGLDCSVRGGQYIDAALRIIGSSRIIRIGDVCDKVSKDFNTTPDNISSGIRYAIRKWWKSAPPDVKKKHFHTSYNVGMPPTNKEFLAYIANENVSVFKEG